MVKLGGSVLTDKAGEAKLRRAVARRLLTEIARAGVPTVLFHGAGSFGHPVAAAHGVGRRTLSGAQGSAAVAAVLSSVGAMHAELVTLAHKAGLRPLSFPLHAMVTSTESAVDAFPADRLRVALEEGHTPIIAGTIIRDETLGWRVLSADESLQVAAEEMPSRLALFVTDVDGVYDRHPDAPGATLLPSLDAASVDRVAAFDEGPGEDVTGRMRGKLQRAIAVAEGCPVLIINGTVRGRLAEALKGRQIPCTRLGG